MSEAATALDKWAHLSFIVSVTAKGLLGAAQLIAGVALFLAPAGALPRLAGWLTRAELAEDPDDRLVLLIERALVALPIDAGSFYAVYFVIHGALNLGAVLALLAGFRWAYPVSIAALAGFVVYQMWKFTQTGDIMMVLLSVLDILVIWLIWREYKALRTRTSVG